MDGLKQELDSGKFQAKSSELNGKLNGVEAKYSAASKTQQNINGGIQRLSTHLQSDVDIIGNALRSFLDNLQHFLGRFDEQFQTSIDALLKLETIAPGLNGPIAQIRGTVRGISSGLQNSVGGILGGLKNGLAGPLAQIRGSLDGLGGRLQGIGAGLGGGLQGLEGLGGLGGLGGGQANNGQGQAGAQFGGIYGALRNINPLFRILDAFQARLNVPL